MVHPKLQTSILLPCGYYNNSSGAIQNNDPFNELDISEWVKFLFGNISINRDAPKSASFTFPFSSDKIFPPFKSR
jgi:hypothetical protein